MTFATEFAVEVGYIHLDVAGEGGGDVFSHGLAHQEEGLEDLFAVQAGLSGHGQGALVQEEPSEQASPFSLGKAQREGLRDPLVVAGGSPELISADFPSFGVVASGASGPSCHVEILLWWQFRDFVLRNKFV